MISSLNASQIKAEAQQSKHVKTWMYQVSSQVAEQWNGLLVEVSTLALFERKSDTTLKEHEWKFNFKSDCSPIDNQSSNQFL